MLPTERATFYGTKKPRRRQPVGVAAIAFSVAARSGLSTYGDEIECVAEDVPVAVKIASLGSDLRSLHETSEALKQSDSKFHKMIQNALYTTKIKEIQIQ